MLIRPARPEDWPSIWAIVEPTIRAAETYALAADMGEDAARAYWLAPDKETFVAEEEGSILGTYHLRANQGGGGRHVCNCGYMTSAHAMGRGIARRMCLHSLDHARKRGYRAMQFNFVVGTTLRYDRDVKLRFYAESGVPEVWIVDARRRQLLVYREPADRSYRSLQTLAEGDTAACAALPQLRLEIRELFVAG